MKTFLLSIALVALTFVSPTISGFEWRYPEPRGKFFGNYVVQAIEAKGILQLAGTRVPQGLYMEGTLDADSAHIGSATIKGCATLTNCIVDGDISICGKGFLKCSLIGGITEIGGTLEAYKTEFCGCIQAASGFIELRGCSAVGMYLFPCGEELQVVKILQGSVIQSDIVFQSGKGRVILDRSSALCGRIHGGILCSSD